MFFGVSIVQLFILVVIIAAGAALVGVALRRLGIGIPPWVMEIFWIVIVAVLVIVAIRVIAGLF